MQDANVPSILLLTEKVDAPRLGRELGIVAPCKVMTPHMFSTAAVYPRLIVCDVEMTDLGAFARVRQALHNHRDLPAPLLCLVSEMSQQALSRAKTLGAKEVLAITTPRETLLDRVAKHLLVNPKGRGVVLQRGAGSASIALAGMLEAAAANDGSLVEQAESGVSSVLATIEQTDIQGWLDVVWKHDDATHQHCLLVSGLAAAIAIELGFSASDRRRLTRAAVLHDIGKSKIPLPILNKVEPLSEAEMEVMRSHAAVGHEILVLQGGIDKETLDVVRHHHEFLDGSGYPDGLKGRQISDIVRLTTICDIYAAMIEHRSYKAAMPPEKAYEALKNMVGKLDGDLVRAFRRAILPVIQNRPQAGNSRTHQPAAAQR